MKRDPLPLPMPAGIDDPRASPWRTSLAAVLLALVWIGAWYARTAASMADMWATSDTYAHGFVVAPIGAWLVWRLRERVGAMTPRSSWTAIVLLAGAGFFWLLGQLGAVNALAQGAFVAMVVLTVPAVLGWDIARVLMFPLCFLFFAVPIGDFLMPVLMERTGDFTVAALRVTGVPVYREGLVIVIPSGRWSIVEACSGVRYLIASLMAGTLFAYLNYRANWRRWVFVGVSIAVPIIANWLRAYLIVMLGHLSSNRLATGVDHLVYGWLFFGIVMLLMFWIGSKWREPASERVPATRSPGTLRDGRAPAPWLPLVVMLAVTAVWPALESVARQRAGDVALAPVRIAGWQPIAGDSIGFEPHYNAPSAVLREVLQRGEARGGLYVAYYRDQDAQRKLVSSQNVLVRSDDRGWLRLAEATGEADLAETTTRIRVTQLRSSAGIPIVAWHWYWIGGTLTSSDAIAKALTAWHRLTGHGDDSAAIVLYAVDDGTTDVDATLRMLARDTWPALAAELARARSAR